MKKTSESNFKILVLLFFGIINSVYMVKADEDGCDASDETLAQWYGQVYNFITTNQNITQQTTNMQAKLEKNIQQMSNELDIGIGKLKIQIDQQEHKMQETQAKIEDSIQEIYNKLETFLKSQLLEQEQRMQKMYNKLEANLTTQLHNNKLEANLTTKSFQEENLKIQQNLAGNNDIVIQRRMDGSEDFQRTWLEYREGFGNKSGEFFIGLEGLHKLTNSRRYELLIDMEDKENVRRHAKYDNFVIGSEAEKYALKSLGTYSGTAGDSLGYHLEQSFSTKDRDNDVDVGRSCAVAYTGAWWYKDCHLSNLNGRYLNGATSEYAKGVIWKDFKGYNYSLKFVEMKIRPH